MKLKEFKKILQNYSDNAEVLIYDSGDFIEPCPNLTIEKFDYIDKEFNEYIEEDYEIRKILLLNEKI